MLDILAAAMMAAAAGLGCWGIITIVERTAPKEHSVPQEVVVAEGQNDFHLPEDNFEITVIRYIRTGAIVNISFILPVPGSWNVLEQSDAWRQFRQAVKEVQKGDPTI